MKKERKYWILTDTHFYHKMIIIYENRPENFNELIIKNCQEMISEDDIIIHLGDVIFSDQSKLKEILDQIPGYKILIRGNHDRQKEQWYKDKGFSEVYKTYSMGQILFSHEPVEISKYPGMKYNVHGHFHSKLRTEESRHERGYTFYTKNHLLLSIELEDYKPVELTEFMSRIKK